MSTQTRNQFKRIGIFDPAFKREGHFAHFNAYIASLLQGNAGEIVFFDPSGTAHETLQHLSPKFRIVSLPMRPIARSRASRLAARFTYWRSVRACFLQESLDFLLITAEARDPLMYLFPPPVPYGVFLLYPHMYRRPAGYRHFKQRFYAWLYRRFVRDAILRASTSEPPILAHIKAFMHLPDISWIPNLPVVPGISAPLPTELMFLTIGTISASKSHRVALMAFKEARLPYAYKIVGNARDAEGSAIQEWVSEHGKAPPLNISGHFSYVSDDEYTQHLDAASFVILPYDFTRGDISSQVLHDCFSRHRPFIAPDIEPFRFYVEKYGIGMLYREGDLASFADTIRRAAASGPEQYLPGFERVSADHSLAAIRHRFTSLLSQP